jgi:Restriction Endonuclease associating with ARP
VNVKRRAEGALEERLRSLGVELDRDGRAAELREVVVSTVDDVMLQRALGDLREGSGGELTATGHRRPKFHSAFSSCALAVNVFGPWRLDPSDLPLDDASGYTDLRFEAQRPIFPSRATPPNLDVLVESGSQVVAIESKATEYLVGNERASFAERYRDAVDELGHESWRNVYELLTRTPEHYRFLNADQLVTHYLGLKRDARDGARRVTLIYAYWEPSDSDLLDPFAEHRREIEDLVRRVDDPRVRFRALGYRDLWRRWQQGPPQLADHAKRLDERYGISVAA